jgi:hypothetical protein
MTLAMGRRGRVPVQESCLGDSCNVVGGLMGSSAVAASSPVIRAQA